MPRPRLRAERRFTVIEGEGRSVNAGQALAYYLMLAMVAVLVLVAGYHWLGDHLISRRLRQVTAVPGYLESTVEVGGIITRREAVVYAPCAGVLAKTAPAGERVLKDAVVARILPLERDELETFQPEEPGARESLLKQFWALVLRLLGREVEPPPPPEYPITGEAPPWLGEGEAVTAPQPGLLSFYVDGWEGTGSFPYIDREEFTGSYEEPRLPEPGAYVEAGQPLLKIVDNWSWHYSVVLPLNPGRTVAAREQVFLTFDFTPESPVEAFLEEVTVNGAREAVCLTYRVERDLDGFSERRWAEAVIGYRRLYGLLVPVEALEETEEGESAVYINRAGTVLRCPVTVLQLDQEQVLVEGLDPYSLVITRPELVREGQRLD